LRKISALIAVFSLVAAACSSAGSAVVGSAGGTDITEAELGSLFESETLPIDENLREAVFAVLAREILLQGLLADFDVELDLDEVESIYLDLIEQMELAGMTPEDFLGLPDASVEMIRFNAEIGVLREQAIDILSQQAETVEAFLGNPGAYTTVCVRHVLVATVDEADAALARLEAGEDFTVLAADSLDTGTPEGDLGCALATRYVPEFAQASLDAEIGVFVGPVETQFGFHVLVVDERTALTEEQVRADPRAFLTDSELAELWSKWFNDTLKDAEVTLDERYGFWSPFGIIPPDRPDLVPTEQ